MKLLSYARMGKQKAKTVAVTVVKNNRIVGLMAFMDLPNEASKAVSITSRVNRCIQPQ